MLRRVAFLRSKSVGGVEPRLDREARALANAGYEVHAVLWDRDLAFPETESRAGYTIHRVRYRAPYNRPSLAWKIPGWWRRALRVLAAIRPDVVHAADWDATRPAFEARARWGAKVVFDVWDFYGDMITAKVPRFLRRRVARSETEAIRGADLVILPDMVRRSRLPPDVMRIIEVINVPEELAITPVPHDGFVVFYGGNLSKDRGLQHLVPACERIGARLLVAGQGPDAVELVRLVRESRNAEFLGYLPHDEVLRHTANADAIPLLYDPAVPINRLASPNKLFEAMMYAKPVVVSEGTSIAELIQREGMGRVVPYGDQERLQQALAELQGSPAERARLGSRGRAAYESRYRWDVMRDRLLAAYASL